MVVDAEAINYITTIKESETESLFTKKVDRILETSLKVIKQLELPEYYNVFKSYIINARQIKMIDRTNNVLCFLMEKS